jgi:hypothetical protein
MGAKTGNSLATFLLSIPIAAVGLMAIFGVPEFAPLNASPDENVVVRDPYESHARSEWSGEDRDDASPYYEDAPPYERDFERSSGYENRSPRDSAGPLRQSSRDPGEGRSTSELRNGRRRFEPEPRDEDRYGSRIRNWSDSPSGPEQGDPRRGSRGLSHASLSDPSDSPAPASRAGGERPFPVDRHDEMPSRGRGESERIRSDELLTWREASRRLADIGIRNYHLERGADEHSFLFVCLFTPGSAPHVTHRFEAEDEDPLMAVNRVLRQIDRWQRQRFAEERFPGDRNRL